MSGIGNVQMGRIGVHALDFRPNGVGIVRQVDAVAEALAHLLLAVGSRKTATNSVLRQHDAWLHKYWRINLIEAAHYLTGQLKHGLLIFASRHGCGLECCDVGCLRYGIAEESHGDVCLEVSHLDFGLHCRVALNSADGYEIHHIGCQF